MPKEQTLTPEKVFREYERGIAFKNGLGDRGLYEQNRINERFYRGDQWHGVHCGGDRPLVRHNVIKRIGEYKLAVVGSAPVTVSYSAEGVPNTLAIKRRVETLRGRLAEGEPAADVLAGLDSESEIQLVMAALSDYFRVTAERVGLDGMRERVLQNAYQTGTGILYTYWDERLATGLYADLARKKPIRGDIACEVLDIENVYFGDPTVEDIQSQPYILVAQRRPVAELRQLAARSGMKKEQLGRIVPDRAAGEPENSQKATLITRFWKEWDEKEHRVAVMAAQVCRGVVVRPPWRLGVRLYPLAAFSWERRRGCAYGESEIPHLIPNQIAINRMLTASVWAVMVMGMPIMVVNGDVVTQPVTNDPGQIVQVFGSGEDVERAVRYVSPPAVTAQFSGSIASLINNTLSQAGINSAMLGDVQPDNTSAIIAVREAAMMPLTMVQNRYYRFCEEVARIWAEFWVCRYGQRSLRVDTGEGAWYLPFDGRRFADLLISVRVDVGASTLWSESQSIETLGNLFDRGLIDAVQYLSRLPKGMVPNLNGLLREMKAGTLSREEVDTM